MVSGFLNLWKPEGMTSHAAVARVRRLSGERHIGHAGTLDPDAAGVLPLALGAYTRLMGYVDLTPKVYRAAVAIGALTHTGDAAGRVVGRSRMWVPSRAQLEASARWLVGTVWQVPPQVSALKSQGRRHYQTVREEGVVWPAPRRVVVEALEDIRPTEYGWEFLATVGSGTYIRALVRDWGYLLGVAVHLSRLERHQVGSFTAHGAVRLTDLEALREHWTDRLEDWQGHVPLPTQSMGSEAARRAAHGDRAALAELSLSQPGRVGLVHRERLVAIVEGPPWRYRVVFGEGI